MGAEGGALKLVHSLTASNSFSFLLGGQPVADMASRSAIRYDENSQGGAQRIIMPGDLANPQQLPENLKSKLREGDERIVGIFKARVSAHYEAQNLGPEKELDRIGKAIGAASLSPSPPMPLDPVERLHALADQRTALMEQGFEAGKVTIEYDRTQDFAQVYQGTMDRGVATKLSALDEQAKAVARERLPNGAGLDYQTEYARRSHTQVTAAARERHRKHADLTQTALRGYAERAKEESQSVSAQAQAYHRAVIEAEALGTKALGKDYARYQQKQALTQGASYRGVIVGENEIFLIQRVSPLDTVRHRKQDLLESPRVGDNVRIGYSAGVGTASPVRDRSLERSRSLAL